MALTTRQPDLARFMPAGPRALQPTNGREWPTNGTQDGVYCLHGSHDPTEPAAPGAIQEHINGTL